MGDCIDPGLVVDKSKDLASAADLGRANLSNSSAACQTTGGVHEQAEGVSNHMENRSVSNTSLNEQYHLLKAHRLSKRPEEIGVW